MRSASVALVALALTVSAGGAQTADPPLVRLDASAGDAAPIHPRGAALAGALLVVLERDAPFLNVYDARGRLVQRTGAIGAGPGEYRAPLALTFDSAAGRLLVLDPATARVTEYEVRDTLRRVAIREIPIEGHALCTIADRVYVMGLFRERMIHELVRDGLAFRLLRSFGQPTVAHPLSANPIVRSRVARGLMACDGDAGVIYAASKTFGDLHVLRVADGSQRTLAVPAFRPMRVHAVRRGEETLVVYEPPADRRYDETTALLPAEGGVRLWIGEADAEHRGNDDYRAFRSVLVRRDGRAEAQVPGRERAAAGAGHRIVCYRGGEEPVITVRRGGRCG